MADEPIVSVKELTKSFQGRRVVDKLSFDVKRGEVFALLGHNGAGKSTTIDLILGLKQPDSGSARLRSGVRDAPLRAIGGWTPLGVGIRLLKSVSLGCYNDFFPQLLCLIAIAAVCATVAVKIFRWE